MKNSCFHASCEGGQLGFLTLDQFLAEVKAAGGTGAQPSNFMLMRDGQLMPAAEIKDTFAKHGMVPESISCHCLNWVHGAAAYANDTSNQVTKQVIPFVPASVYKRGADEVEQWALERLFDLMDLANNLKVKILHTFFGPYQGWEVVSGYPWGFLKGGSKEFGTDYDLIAEGLERFAQKTGRMRQHANALGIYFGHEIHRNSAAACADDFAALVEACDGDKCVAVGADPSHCDEGEGWEARYTHPAVAPRIVIAHVKNFRRRTGVFAGRITGTWSERSKEFSTHGDGEVNLVQYAEVLAATGYPTRFCQITGRPTAPLVSEAEVARQDQLSATVNGIHWVHGNMLIVPSTSSFEDGMGEAGKKRSADGHAAEPTAQLSETEQPTSAAEPAAATTVVAPLPAAPATASEATPEMPIGFPDSVVAGGQERSTAAVEPAATATGAPAPVESEANLAEADKAGDLLWRRTSAESPAAETTTGQPAAAEAQPPAAAAPTETPAPEAPPHFGPSMLHACGYSAAIG